MDLSYPPEAEEFRTEIRSWLEQNLPEGWFDEGFEMDPQEKKRFNEQWTQKLHEGGWICATWPEEYGGKGLSTMEGVTALAAAAAARFPTLNILVNNAGATWGMPLDEFDEHAWDKVMDTNVKGLFFLTQRLLPQLRAAGTADDPARVINIGSIDGLHVNPMDTYSYAASKAGVHHLTRTMARKLGPEHITVNAVAPGPFESKMMAATLQAFGDSIAKSSPLGRIGRPDDMAGVTVFLASRAGSYLTGAVIPVDGGIATTS